MIPSYEEFECLSVEYPESSFQISAGSPGTSKEQIGKEIADHPGKKLNPPKKIQKRFWRERDNKLYLEFLLMNEEEFTRPVPDRTSGRLNVRMSSHIGFKNAKQCRSHHQKMLIKCKDVRGIIAFLRKLLGQRTQGQEFHQAAFETDQLEKNYFELYGTYEQEWSQIGKKTWFLEEDSGLL